MAAIRYDMGKPTAIADILRARLAGLGIARQMSEASAEHLWPELVGEEIAGHTRVVRAEAGRLVVAVDSANDGIKEAYAFTVDGDGKVTPQKVTML